MDHQPGRLGVVADSAVFTSVRTLTSEGYRLVAASPGVTAEERTELRRSSPSHNSLCNDRVDAAAFSAYRLSSGRYCVAHSCSAGAEHTGRGGSRVYTRIAVLDDAAMEAFACDPARVYAALSFASDGVELSLPPELEPVTLDPSVPALGASGGGVDGRPDPCHVARLVTIFLRPRQAVVVAPEAPIATFAAAMAAIPAEHRRTVSCSVGLRFAASREITVTVVPGDEGATRRAIRGHAIEWLDLRDEKAFEGGEHANWARLVQTWIRGGRHRELAAVTDAVDEPLTAGAVFRLASLCDLLDRVQGAPPEASAEFSDELALLGVRTNAERVLADAVAAAVAKNAPVDTQPTDAPTDDADAVGSLVIDDSSIER